MELLMFTLDCTYNEPSNRRRVLPTLPVQSVDYRLQHVETLLHTLLDRTSQSKPVLEIVNQPGKASSIGNSDRLSTLETTLDSGGRLNVDNNGHQVFCGSSSGLAFLAQFWRKLGGSLGPEAYSIPSSGLQPRMPHVFDCYQSTFNQQPIASPRLPPKSVAKYLVQCALEKVCILCCIVHRPTFDSMLDRIYDVEVANQGTEESSFLPILYGVLALGYYASNAGTLTGGVEDSMFAAYALNP